MIYAPVLHMKNLLGYVNAVFNKFNEKYLYYKENRQEPVREVFGGDKGGHSTKFHFSIGASGVTTSAYDVKIFAIYEAADSRDNMRKILHPFYNTIKDMQHPDFRLQGRKIKFFLNGDFKNLDLLLGHQGSGARYPSLKDEVERVHLREHGDVPHTPETCPLVLRTVDEIREHHVANVVDDRINGSDRAMALRGKLHKSIVSGLVFPISSLGNVVPPVLHITLGIVLKMFNMLVEHVKSQHSASNEPRNDENNKKWQEKSEELLGRETEFKRVCLKLLDLYNIQARHQAKSENENDEELDEIAKLSTNESKLHRKNILKCSASRCLVLQFDSAPEWVQCNTCDSWVHMMCEVIPDLDFEHIKHMPSYECLNCQSYSAQDVSIHVDHQIGVKRQAYHGNVFVGNHCKVILAKDKNQVFNFVKLCNFLTDEVTKDHFVELLKIYCEARSLMARRHLLSENEKETLKSLRYNFGALFPIFLKAP